MGLLRTYAVVFLAGWALWFWLDNSTSARQPMAPPYGGAPRAVYPPHPGAPGQAPPRPPTDGDIIQEFQYSTDLLKSGEYRQSFVYLWRRESWIAAAVVTALLLLAGPGLAQLLLTRRRMQARPHSGDRPPR